MAEPVFEFDLQVRPGTQPGQKVVLKKKGRNFLDFQQTSIFLVIGFVVVCMVL